MGFRKDFLWGGAISACQAEGAWDEDGKVMTFPEVIKAIDPSKRKEMRQAYVTQEVIDEAKTAPVSDYPKRWGIDFYHTYKGDIKLFAEMGFKVFASPFLSQDCSRIWSRKSRILLLWRSMIL